MQVPIFLYALKTKLNSVAFLLGEKKETMGLSLQSSDTDFTCTHVCFQSLRGIKPNFSHLKSFQQARS